jgi:hypothetical protein
LRVGEAVGTVLEAESCPPGNSSNTPSTSRPPRVFKVPVLKLLTIRAPASAGSEIARMTEPDTTSKRRMWKGGMAAEAAMPSRIEATSKPSGEPLRTK